LQVTSEEPNGAGVLVRSKIIKSNGEPVQVDYAMHQSGGTWLISDIYLDGTISELATRRSEFSAIIRNQGIDGLIQSLNRKADMLTGTTARAY
jgi:phospholipid transport system substrate-binding protein